MHKRTSGSSAGIRRTLTVLALTSLFMGFGLSAAEAKRLALVIGNADYVTVPKLKNAAKDAKDVADALTRLGFEVTLLTDLRSGDLAAQIDAFSAEAQTAESTVFYYAGHAFQMSGVNYLVPVDAALQSREAIRAETWNLDGIIARLQDRKRQTLVFLDACRNDPVPQSVRGSGAADGLARMQTGVGTFVAFATEPGAVTYDGAGDAPNSPFTASLLKNIETPGLSISDMMIKVRNEVAETTGGKQTPWDQSSLREQFYFQVATEAKQELSEADYELLAQLSPEDRAKFLDLLRESGFSEESLQQADDAITIASYNLEVAADSSVVIEAVTEADVVASLAVDEGPELALEVIDSGPSVDGAEVASVEPAGEAEDPALEVAALEPQPEVPVVTEVTPPEALVENPAVEPAPEALPETEIATVETAPETAPETEVAAVEPAPEAQPETVIAAVEPEVIAEVSPETTPDVAEVLQTPDQTEVAAAESTTGVEPVTSIPETVVAVLPQPEPLAPLGSATEEAPIRLAALTWQTRGVTELNAVADGFDRVTGNEIVPDTDANREFLASIDPSLLLDQAAVVDPADLSREAQSELARLGCYRMAVDGSWGKGSRTALTSYFLAKRAVPDTLEPTAELVAQLKGETKVVCEVQVARARVVPGKTKAILPQTAAAEGTVKVRASAGRKAVTVEKAKKNITKQLSGGMGFN